MITQIGHYRKSGILTEERGENGGQIGMIVGFTVAAAVSIILTWGASTPAVVAGYAAFFGAIGATAGQLIGNAIDPVKGKETKNTPQSGIKDFYVTSAALGQMVPILYGTYRIPGNIIQAGRKVERDVETVVSSPVPGSKGKGGGEDVQIIVTKAYDVTMGIALCEGPIKAIKRIWTDLDLFYDDSSDLGHLRFDHETENTIHFNGVNNSVSSMIVYKGTETQEPDPTLNGLATIIKGTDPETGEPLGDQTAVSAYRGTAYAAIANFDLGASGRLPNFTFEVVRDHTAVERPVDIALGDNGLYVLYTKDMISINQTVHYTGLYVQFCENREFNFNYIFHKLPNGDPDYTDWGAMGFMPGAPVTIEGAIIDTNNGTFMLTMIANNVMVFDRDFSYDLNQVDMTQAKTPINTKNRLGTLRSYQTPFLQEASSRSTGRMSTHLALANMNGGANDLSFVVSTGSVDGIDDTTDMGYVFVDGLNLGDPNDGHGVALRTSGEIGSKIGVGHVSSNGDRYFYICLEEINALAVFDATSNAFARVSLGAKPTESVWSPLGGGGGYVYVLRADDRVERFEGGFNLPSVDQIPVGAGAGSKGYGHIMRASTNRIWVSNAYANTLSHFTTAGDAQTVNVMSNPRALAEARDGFIWTASFDRGEMCRIDPTTYAVETFEIPDIMDSLAPARDGKMWAVASNTRSAIYLFATDGTYEMLNLPYGASKVVSDTSGDPYKDGYAYVMCEASNTVVSVTPDCNRFYTIDSGAGLARCVEDMAVRSGLSPDRIDTSGLLNSQVNFIVSEVASAKDTISLMAEAFLFSFVESEGYIRFFHNYAVSTVAEISENTLAGGIDKEDPKSMGVSRLQERELPTKVSVTYTSAERNYQDRAEIVQLTSGNIEQNPQVYRYPFAMTTEDAYQLAEVRLFEPWTQRERMEFTLPPLFILLDPGDAVQVHARDISYNIHVSEMTRARTWLNTVRGVSTYPPTFPDPAPAALALRTPRALSPTTPRQLGIYQDTIPTPGKNTPIMDPNNPGVALSVPGTGLISLQNPSRMAIVLIDPPALSPTDIILRAYLGTYRMERGKDFSQTTLYRSPNGTVDFTFAASDGTESTAGRALTALGPVDNPGVWDDINTVDVELLHGTLRMVSEMDVLSGANRAMLGGELIQFMRPTLLAPNTYRLSRLLRGRLGTEGFTETHAVGDTFILFDPNTLRDTYLYERAIVDREYFYRVVDSVTSLTSAQTMPITLHGNSLKPWAPVLKPALHTGDDITLNWLYRARLNPDLVDYGGIAWDIDFTKQFQIFIYTTDFAAVQSIYTTPVFPGSAENTLVFVYTAAQQLADFGSLQTEVYYGIAGLGAQNVLGYESRGIA